MYANTVVTELLFMILVYNNIMLVSASSAATAAACSGGKSGRGSRRTPSLSRRAQHQQPSLSHVPYTPWCFSPLLQLWGNWFSESWSTDSLLSLQWPPYSLSEWLGVVW